MSSNGAPSCDGFGDDAPERVRALDDRDDAEWTAPLLARCEHGPVGRVELHALGHQLPRGFIA